MKDGSLISRQLFIEQKLLGGVTQEVWLKQQKKSHCDHSCCHPATSRLTLPYSFLPRSLFPSFPLPHYTHTHTHKDCLAWMLALSRHINIQAIWTTKLCGNYGRCTCCPFAAASSLVIIALSTAEVVQRLVYLAYLQCRRQPLCHYSCTLLPSSFAGVSLSLCMLPLTLCYPNLQLWNLL